MKGLYNQMLLKSVDKRKTVKWACANCKQIRLAVPTRKAHDSYSITCPHLYFTNINQLVCFRLRKGTQVGKRHAPVWQAWGVLETRYSTAKVARDVFQQGIWACAQPSGGQSGGRRCARLWQAWGILEDREGDHAAARRCFSRALDADQRNVAALTAWTLMEADLGNFADARCIFEKSLKLFRSPSADKTSIWRAYEVMEERAGNTREAQLIFKRSMAEAIAAEANQEITPENPSTEAEDMQNRNQSQSKLLKKKEVEVSRWGIESSELDSKVWMNNGSIEGKVPASTMKRLKNRR